MKIMKTILNVKIARGQAIQIVVGQTQARKAHRTFKKKYQCPNSPIVAILVD